MCLKIYHATLCGEGWNDTEDIGYFLTKEKAWEACFKHHPTMKSLRICYDYYDFLYKHYKVIEIEVQK